MNSVNLQMGDFKPYYARIYSVGAMVVDKEFEFDNEFGEGHYVAKPGDIVLEGTKGEHWIVPEAKFLKKYEMDGQSVDMSQIARGSSLKDSFTKVDTKESKAITWAAQVTAPDALIISPEGHQLTANNSQYEHGNGDYICCSDNNGMPSFEWGCWPVNGLVFENTYELAPIEHNLGMHEADSILDGDGVTVNSSNEPRDKSRDNSIGEDDDHDEI